MLKVDKIENDDYFRIDKNYSKKIEEITNGTSNLKEDLSMIREKPQNKPIKISIDPNRVLDHKRVILINLNNAFSNDHLELYLEYLSDEIEIQRFDFSKENKNVAMITFREQIGKLTNW